MTEATPDRRQRVERRLRAALDGLDAERREPDRWEEECLTWALGALGCNMLLVAEVELDAFARAPSERSPQDMAPLASTPPRFNKAMLRAGLERLVQRPAGSVTPLVPFPDRAAFAETFALAAA